MGATQSSDQANNSGGLAKTGYYELLGVDRQATEDQVKKAYRRKALELHPDRNYGQEEAATKTFAEIQAAYEILSDPQERAWYDSHESAILRGDDNAGPEETPTYQNVKITTADDVTRLIRKFNSNIEFSDSPTGFFGFLRETFDRLAMEEDIAAKWENVSGREYPPFGHKDDKHEDVVKSFYASWSSFSTVKTFVWRDKWKLSEAPDRWVRRKMKKENKDLRHEGAKEFNEAVRSLVAFIRKRDPRYVASAKSESERQKALRDAAAAQAARARAANQAKLHQEVPEWTKFREPEELEQSEEEQEDQQVLECMACKKIFKSEKQWQAHERSKKHQKAVCALTKKMRKEHGRLDLTEEETAANPAELGVREDVEAEQRVERDPERVDTPDSDGSALSDQLDGTEAQGNNPVTLEDSDSDEGFDTGDAQASGTESKDTSTASSRISPSLSALQDRFAHADLKTNSQITLDVEPSCSEADQATSTAGAPKMGKAAQKRAKKAAAAVTAEAPPNTHRCVTCQASFPSRTSLFQHINKNGHATAKAVPSGPNNTKAKKAKGGR